MAKNGMRAKQVLSSNVVTHDYLSFSVQLGHLRTSPLTAT